jgi:hypothetical protein
VPADYGVWPPLLLMLMFSGGCTGSTAGGLKVARMVLMLHVVHRDFRRLAESQGVFRIRAGGEVLPELAVTGLLNLVFLALILMLVASLLVFVDGTHYVQFSKVPIYRVKWLSQMSLAHTQGCDPNRARNDQGNTKKFSKANTGRVNLLNNDCCG